LRPHFLSAAEREYVDTVRYYSSQSVELGRAFYRDVEHAVDLIEQFPQIGAPFDVDKRRLILRRFPYSLIYQERPSEIVIAAVRHHRQDPQPWSSLG
jgi:plasmid stabilization system protein ParE